MVEFESMIKNIHPGIFIHSVYIEEDESSDRRAGFYGNVNEQIDGAAEQIAAIEELKGGVDAMGLSQGGQFLRAYVERFNSPPVHNLITWGSQHFGVSDIPPCRPGDFLCEFTRRAIKGGVYSSWAQNNLVQAQYYRDPTQMDAYLAANHFLASINNEVKELRNETYAHNLASLDKLVLILFTRDKTVVPKESAWFGSEAAEDELGNEAFSQHSYETPEYTEQIAMGAQHPTSKIIIPMRLQPLYVEDWIGLRELDERGDVVLESCEGEHMQMSDCWEDVVRKYVGGIPE
jgi:palmitoyl-protein thioesterase